MEGEGIWVPILPSFHRANSCLPAFCYIRHRVKKDRLPDADWITAGIPDPHDPTFFRLTDQIGWYNRKSGSSKRIFLAMKTVEIAVAAVIPFLAAIELPSLKHKDWIIGGLGMLIAVLEGVLQLNQFEQNWISYRSTCESLKHEKYVFLAGAGPYANASNPKALLAERIESLVSQEHAKWASVQQQAKSPSQSQSGSRS
jgi:hypothetical protein